jgi:hypothetical protein
VLTLLDGFEPSGVVKVFRSAEVAGVITLGMVMRVTLDPLGTTVGSVSDHPVEQPCGYSVATIWRGNDEA